MSVKLICRAVPHTASAAVNELKKRKQSLNASLLEQGIELAGKKATVADAVLALRKKLGTDAQVRHLMRELRTALSCGTNYSAAVPDKPGEHEVECPNCGTVHHVVRT